MALREAKQAVTAAQRDILELAGRYRLLTIDVAHEVFYPDETREAARVALWRLAAAGWLWRFEVRNRSFYQLTADACRLLGEPPSAASPLGVQALVERYALLHFCCTRPDVVRVRIAPAELRDKFPRLAAVPGIDPTLQHYVAEATSRSGKIAPRLLRVAVDSGGEIKALTRKVRRIARDAQAAPRGALELVLVTPTTSRTARMEEVIRADLSLGVSFQVETVSELLHVL